MNTPTKTCPSCKHTKPLAQFSRNSGNVDGHQKYCKQCVATKKRADYAQNPDKYLEVIRRSRARKQRELEYYRSLHPELQEMKIKPWDDSFTGNIYE